MFSFRRKISSFCVIFLLICTVSVALPIQNAGAVSGDIPGVPRHVMVGYWHNFFNGTTRTKLRDVPASWNVINLSFGEPDSSTSGNIIFKASSEIYTTGGDIETEFRNDIKFCQDRGQKVMLSIGGQNGIVTLSTTQARDKFVQTVTGIIDTYGLDGLDVDFEGHSLSLNGGDKKLKNPTTPSVVNLISALKTICARYGDDFLLTMAPETLLCQNGYAFYGGSGDSRNGVYLAVIDALRDNLSWLQVQYYNTANGYTPEGLISSGSVYYNVVMMDMMMSGFYCGEFYKDILPLDPENYFAGLRPDQMVMGVPSGTGAAGTGTMTPAQYIEALNLMRNGGTVNGYTVKNPSKDFRGIMTWSVNWDEFHSRNFSSVMGPYIGGINAADTPEFPVFVNSITASPSGTASVGSPITWTADASGGVGALQYKFDVYKDGALLSAGTYASSSSFAYTPTSEGSYYVKAFAKDPIGTVMSRQSATVSAINGVVLTGLSADKTMSSYAGDPIIWNATATSQLGSIQYKFDLYKDGTLLQAGAFSSSHLFTYAPASEGIYSVKVTAKDSGTSSEMNSAMISVSDPLSVSGITADKNGLQPTKTRITFSANQSGGIGAIRYQFIITRGTKICYISALSPDSICAYAGMQPGEYTVSVYCQDSKGTTKSVLSTFILT